MEKKSFFRRPSDEVLDRSEYTESVAEPVREERVEREFKPRGERNPRAERDARTSRTGSGSPERAPRGERRDFRKVENRAPREPREAPENVIFGTHPIREALQAGRPIEKIYMRKATPGDYSGSSDILSEIEALAGEASVNVQWVPNEKLDRLSRRGNHQGVVATLPPIEYADINAVLEAGPKLLLVLDGITDVRNFGAIARSAECAGVDAIIVGAKSCAPINGEAMKSSAGALNRVPVCRVGSLRLALKNIQSREIQLVAATEKGAQTLFATDLTRASAIVMGSEERGISSEILKMCDQRVSIPLLGQIESLNVSAAASIILFEAVRQRNQ